MADHLGPFQDFWEVWNNAHERIVAKDLDHFRGAVGIQFDEMEQHLAAGDTPAAAKEIADVISIALNTLRKLGYQPEEVATLVRERAGHRMKDRVHEILDKYEREYGI